MFVYKNGVYYMDSLQDDCGCHREMIMWTIRKKYISASRMIQWDDFANDFSVQVYNNKAGLQEKESDYFGSYWHFLEELLLILSVGMHSNRSVSFQIKSRRCRHKIWQIHG